MKKIKQLTQLLQKQKAIELKIDVLKDEIVKEMKVESYSDEFVKITKRKTYKIKVVKEKPEYYKTIQSIDRTKIIEQYEVFGIVDDGIEINESETISVRLLK